MKILNGKELSAKLKDELKAHIDEHKQTPIMAVITIGNDEASKVYVKNKKLACEYVGISFLHFAYEANVDEKVVIEKIEELNNDNSINGILLQLPLPDGYDANKLLNTINPIKDVDGLTRKSMGSMLSNEDGMIPCTPKGIIKILDFYGVELEGKSVVVIGRSNLVGKPIALECLKRNATVTICHSKTKNLDYYTKIADILIVATGNKWLINKDMVKKDAVIIDVGINRGEDGHLYGDVNPDVESVANALTPVPGGVGPMTVYMLLENLFIAYKKMNGITDEE